MELSPIEKEAIRQMDRRQKKASKRFRKSFFKETGKKFKQKPSGKSLKKECDELWIELIKKKAGYKSELSGKGRPEIVLTAHHIVGKPNLYLRYLIENGICLDNHTEHIYGVHNKFNPPVAKENADKIIHYIGLARWNRLNSFIHKAPKVDLVLIKIYLQQELKKIGK